MKALNLITTALIISFAAACNSLEPTVENETENSTETEDKTEDKSEYKGLTHLEFTESDKAFPNPERGFYHVKNFRSVTEVPLNQTVMDIQRALNRTITYICFYPTDYMDGDIAEDFLQVMRTNFQVLRDYGSKCVLRFAYSDSEDEKPWDPSPEIVQRHIQNIKPIIQEYSDVILTFQAGFIGVWGEWYYTDNFVFVPQSEEDHKLRKQVVDAMLEILPSDRTVSLRTPMFKRMMYANDYTDTLTVKTAYNGSAKARISAFNDCFGADDNDMGTFNSKETREYWKKDSRYTLMGGETCGLSAYCKCDATLKDMEDYHWTYLNSAYHGQVIGRWRTDGCLDEIERRLGYRLHISDLYHTANPAPGEDFNMVLKIKNTGFAAPMNGRMVELILEDGNGNQIVLECNDIDPRYWFAGETATIDKVIKIPANATGKCSLYLNLPDPKETLRNNPRFSIRLANDNVWNEETGYNKIAEFTL